MWGVIKNTINKENKNLKESLNSFKAQLKENK
jgi:hypothetical protein